MAGKKGSADGMKKWAGLLLAFLLWLGATASAAVQLGDRAEDTVSTVEALKQTLGLTTLPMGTGGLDAFLAYEDSVFSADRRGWHGSRHALGRGDGGRPVGCAR